MRANRAFDGEFSTDGWTKQELMNAGELSAKAFDRLRKAARVRGPSHGGLKWIFSVDDLVALVKRAESGSFSDFRAGTARAWRELLKVRGVEVV
jgi:hypothetical protein